MMKHKKQKKAFTIIEFMISMTFLAVLLIGITTITMQILEIYRKGLALRAINSTGRDILNDMSRIIGGSPIVERINPTGSDVEGVSTDDILKAYRGYFYETTDTFNSKKVQSGGVFCTGSYSYIWNDAPAIKMAREDNNYVNNLLRINGKYYKFARIPDADRTVCERNSDTDDSLKTKNFTVENENSIVSLISDDDTDLALYDFLILPATQNNVTGQIFYSGMFILATMRGGVNVLSNGDFCTGSEKMYSTTIDSTNQDFNYCAVNKFNFAMRATGQSNNADQYGER